MTIETVAAAIVWFGASLVISTTRWGRRSELAERLAGHLPGRSTSPAGDVDLRDVVAPLAQRWGTRAARIVGVNEEAEVRLERIHADVTVGEWRLRQFTRTLLAFLVGVALVIGSRPSAPIAALFTAGAPAITFLAVEQQLASRSSRRQRALLHELPLVAEQLGMLLSAGYSVGAAIDRVAEHGRGVAAPDLRRVCSRVRHGVGEHRALREWADLSGVAAVERLVDVLALDHEASDLGRLVSQEARSVRREVHRELVELMERRAQQVWIPVTVAALVPGVIFLAVPFVAAMQLFTTS